MFTGLIEEKGHLISKNISAHSGSLVIGCQKILEDIHLGDSIAVNGVCLTVTAFTSNSFTVDVMPVTYQTTALHQVRIGAAVNLERAMSLQRRFGGHIVSGHIDDTGTVVDLTKDEIAWRIAIKPPKHLLRYIILKGAITIDGISLTIAALDKDTFTVSIIPHTAANTTLATIKQGMLVNLEVDCIGKYVERLQQYATPDKAQSPSTISYEFLLENGF